MTAITETKAAGRLPDLPGMVHGIKSNGADWSIQCDDCLTVHTGRSLILVARRVIFNSRAGVPGLRLCSDCWAARGWAEDYWGWNYTEPREA